MIAHGLVGDLEPARYLDVAQTLGDEFQHFAFPRGQLIQQQSRTMIRRNGKEFFDLVDELVPCRLGVEQDVITALEWDEPCIGNERRDCAAIVERKNRTLPRMQDKRRATDLRQQIMHVGLYESSKQRNYVIDRCRPTEQLVEGSSLLGCRIRNMKRRQKRPKSWNVLWPAQFRRLELDLHVLHLLARRLAGQRSCRRRSVED